jgi:hypothetical protein
MTYNWTHSHWTGFHVPGRTSGHLLDGGAKWFPRDDLDAVRIGKYLPLPIVEP